ncbi:hypothetical protein [Haloplanus natans]|uniref:hypothetical protein n=1 Tax=Haloplanus natans TaxID=376171 RepID=UPI0012FC0FF0|nr:hypothetical protein [Haloplanus natans]
MSTIPEKRRPLVRALLDPANGGVLTTRDVCDLIGVSKPTAGERMEEISILRFGSIGEVTVLLSPRLVAGEVSPGEDVRIVDATPADEVLGAVAVGFEGVLAEAVGAVFEIPLLGFSRFDGL